MPTKRESPENILRRVQEAERRAKRGKLKIYLGAAPGVGKTYQMLRDAIEIRKKGLDVVVGIAESHGRIEIEALLKCLEFVPRKYIDYHGHSLNDLDLDEVIKRAPGLALVDEMAHTNVPGLRHTKRWQDIKELLDHGIDVFTTLNVQHIESLSDDVAQIIQAPILETVPDSIIDAAETIEIVDLPPEDLLKRLQEGKIYIPQQAQIATEHFFRRGNLIALRELALRVTAEHVGAEVVMYRQGEGIKKIWPTQEKILVCINEESESLKLIRAAKRFSNTLQAELMVVYVDKPKLKSAELKRNQAIKNLHLAELLGAKTYVISGYDIVKEIINFAREKNVTQLMIWKHIYPRWLTLFKPSISDEILRESHEINVNIITEEPSKRKKIKSPRLFSISPWKTYVKSLLIVGFTTLFNYFFIPYLTLSSIVMIDLLSIIATALYGRMGPTFVAAILNTLAYAFIFIQPQRFSLEHHQNFLSLMVLMVVSLIISYVVVSTRRETEFARHVQHQTTALYEFNRQLTTTWGLENLLAVGTNFMANAFACDVIILLPENNTLKILSYSKKYELNAKEQSIAEWVFNAGKMAGLGTETLSFSKGLYLPLMTSKEPMGVVSIYAKNQQLFTPEQMRLIESCVHQLALALEVERLQKRETKKEVELESNKARTHLLKSISKNIPPLNTIMEAAKADDKLNPANSNISTELERLQRLNQNIQHYTTLDEHAKSIDKANISIPVIIKNVVKKFDPFLINHIITIYIADKIPHVFINEALLEEVLINLLDNAVKYSPAKTTIEISACVESSHVLVCVEDSGLGINPDELSKLFKTFYRGKQPLSKHGLGLGLAICQKIIKIHGGRIWAENKKNGGASFRFTIPI